MTRGALNVPIQEAESSRPRPDRRDLKRLVQEKWPDIASYPWGRRWRLKLGYFTPDEIYQATVSGSVTESTTWLDVGSGRDLMRNNRALARTLAGRCKLLAGVDPSDNIDENADLHERFKCEFEQFHTERRFDLVTMQMVAEHMERPKMVVQALGRVVKLDGRVIVYTVAKHAPVTLISSAVPFRFHHRIKRIFWNGEESDTFPTYYRMNTRRDLRRLFEGAGFREEAFRYIDDCRTLARWPLLDALEVTAWRMLAWFRLHYPETCILAVYRKTS